MANSLLSLGEECCSNPTSNPSSIQCEGTGSLESTSCADNSNSRTCGVHRELVEISEADKKSPSVVSTEVAATSVSEGVPSSSHAQKQCRQAEVNTADLDKMPSFPDVHSQVTSTSEVHCPSCVHAGCEGFQQVVVNTMEPKMEWILTFEQFVGALQKEPVLCQFFAEQNTIDLSGTSVDPVLNPYTRTILATSSL